MCKRQTGARQAALIMFLTMLFFRLLCYLLLFVPLNANDSANAERMPVYIVKINDFTYLHKYSLMNYCLINLLIGVISNSNQILFQRIYSLMLYYTRNDSQP